MQISEHKSMWASSRILLTHLIILSLILVIIIPAQGLSSAAPPVEEISGTETGWIDSFDDTSKISGIDNMTVENGHATLNGTYNKIFDGLSWTKHGMVLDNGGALETTYVYVPYVIKDNSQYKMWYQGYDGTNIRILYATSPDGISWTKEGIAIDIGGIYDSDHVAGPCVLKVGNEYKMWYNGNDGTNARILYANSPDGVTWTKQGLAVNIGGAGEDTHVSSSSVIIDDNGQYKMWYIGNSGSSNIFLATSPDGLSWSKQGQVMAYGALYEELSVYRPSVIKHQSVYHMWYSGKSSSGRARILYATSVDGVSWNKEGLALNYGDVACETDSVESPAVIIDNGQVKMWYTGSDWTPQNARILYAQSPIFFDPLTWQKQGLAFDLSSSPAQDYWTNAHTHLIKDNGTYRMWYTGHDGFNYRIFYATSVDGVTWNKQGLVMDIGTPGGFEDTYVGHPYVIKDGSTYKMWYGGYDGSTYRILYATSLDCMAWTRYGLVLDIGTDGSMDDDHVYGPCVMKNSDNSYTMWYTGEDGVEGRIMKATSIDGLSWIKEGAILLGDGSHTPSVQIINEIYYMYYGKSYKIHLATSVDGENWTKHGLAISVGSSGDTDDDIVLYPSFLLDNDGYVKLWYAGRDGTNYRIHYAKSPIFFIPPSWEKQGIVVDTDTPDDSDHARAPSVIKDGTTYKMWYQGHDGTTYRILYATSTDGISWVKGGVVLDIGGLYDSTELRGPCVVKDGATYKMWYTGSDGVNQRILYATSADGITWTKQGLAVDIGGAGETVLAHDPEVIIDGGEYKMWYVGYDGSNNRIFHATSVDGIVWVKQGLVMNYGNLYEEIGVRTPCVLKIDDFYQMWYSGKSSSFSRLRILYATSSDGMIWTKQGLALDFGDVPGEDETAFEPCIIEDGNLMKIWYTGIDWVPVNKARILYATTPITRESTGQIISTPINLPAGYSWESVNLTKEELTGNTITLTVLNAASGTPIPGYQSLTDSNIDITGIDGGTYPVIQLQANFSGNGSATPTLLDWCVNWTWDGDTPIINHTAIVSANLNDVINITANLTDNVAITEVMLCYKNVGDLFYTNTSMVLTSGNIQSGNWSADISAQIQLGIVYYYINATDGSLNSSDPFYSSYTNPHAIDIFDIIPPEIIHTSPAFLNTSDDVDITVQVSDNIGIDDVRLSYYFDTVTGFTISQNISMIDLGGGNYDKLINIPDNALTLYYNILVNDTSNNWNLTGEINLAITDTLLADIFDSTIGIPATSSLFTIDAVVIDNIDTGTIYLNYLFLDSGSTYIWQNISMNDLGGNNYDYALSIPADALWLQYNISAVDTSGNWNESGIITRSISDTIIPDIFDITIGMPSTGIDYTLIAQVTDNINVSISHVNFQFENSDWTSPWYNLTMTYIGGDDFSYTVPIQDNSTLFRYYFSASDNSSNWNSSLIDEPIVADIIIPEITGLNSSIPETSENYAITANVSDNIDVDEVHVFYYFNTISGNTSAVNISMNYTGDGNYVYNISLPEDALFLCYNISANDTSNNWNESNLQILSVLDTIKPSILDLTSGIPSTGEDFTITAMVTDNILAAEVCLNYQFETEDGFSELFNVSMSDIGGDNYNYAVPILDTSTLFRYFISAGDNSSNWYYISEVELAVNDALAPDMVDITTGVPVTGGFFEININIIDNIETDYARVYVYYDLIEGNYTPQNITMTRITGDTYHVNVSIPINAITLHYSVMANDTSNNWNLIDVISRDVNDNQTPFASYPSSALVNMGSPFIFNGSNSTDNIGIVNYSWVFTFDKQVVVLYGMEAAFNFTEVGTYSITFTVIDADNNWNSIISVLQAVDTILPISDPGSDPLFTIEGELMFFDGASSWDNVGIENYTWSFLHNGSMVHIYGESPEFVFWEEGSVTVTLHVTDTVGNSDEETFTVRVLNNPTIDDGFPWWLFPLILIILLAIVITLFALKKSDKSEEETPSDIEPEIQHSSSDSEILNNIETRYAEGHISEDTYNMLKEKYAGGKE